MDKKPLNPPPKPPKPADDDDTAGLAKDADDESDVTLGAAWSMFARLLVDLL